jgi:hypothetical protein
MTLRESFAGIRNSTEFWQSYYYARGEVISMSSAIECLNGLLRGEISAVETYNQARERITLPVVTPVLQDGQIAHQTRVQMLAEKIESLGGERSEGAGAWGAFANFLEGTAGLLGDKASVDMLEEGEDHGLQIYRDEIENCEDGAVRTFIKDELLPRQEETHEAMSNLKHTMEQL